MRRPRESLGLNYPSSRARPNLSAPFVPDAPRRPILPQGMDRLVAFRSACVARRKPFLRMNARSIVSAPHRPATVNSLSVSGLRSGSRLWTQGRRQQRLSSDASPGAIHRQPELSSPMLQSNPKLPALLLPDRTFPIQLRKMPLTPSAPLPLSRCQAGETPAEREDSKPLLCRT